MFERFTDRLRKVLSIANQEAHRFNHEYVGTEHLLLAMVKEGSGVAAGVLKNLGIDLRVVRLEVEKLVQSGPDMVIMGKLPQTPGVKKVIDYALEEARSLNHNYIGTEHLLLGLVRQNDGVAAHVLRNLQVSLEGLREETLNMLGASATPTSETTSVPAKAFTVTFGTTAPTEPAQTSRQSYIDDRFGIADTSLRQLLSAISVDAEIKIVRELADLIDVLEGIRDEYSQSQSSST